MSLRLGVIGENISYSLSPAIFKWGFRQTRLEGEFRVYDYSASEAVRFISGGTWDGLSVTVPHKSLAFDLCTRATARAQVTHAVNTLFRKHGELWGDDTDVQGMRFALSRTARNGSEPKHALVIGSGGAARAAVFTLGEMWPDISVSMATRDKAIARERCSVLCNHREKVQFISPKQAASDLARFGLIVQATPVGGPFLPGLPLPEPLNFSPSARVLDMIYAPRETEFLKRATASGAHSENGLVMLLAQAAAAFQLWTQTEFPLTRVLNELLPEFASA